MENQQGTGEERKSLIDPINPTENQQGTGEERKSLTDPINLMENQQGTGKESKSLTDPINLMENQQGTGEERKSLTDPINPTENQQDKMAEAESNIVDEAEDEIAMKCAQVVLDPLDAVRAIKLSRLAVENELRIALVGKTGVGKSATANTICGINYFKSGVCGQAMTQRCEQKKATRLGKDICIIDTPGIFDPEADQGEIEKEIKRCVHLGAPGLHAILFVMEIGRVTKENINTIDTFLNFFEKEMKNRVIVVFTHGDKLQKMEQTLSKYLETIPKELETFLKSCQNRFILFNNNFNKEQSNEQVSSILLMIDTLKKSNEYAFYSDEVFKKAEESVRQREEEIRKMLKIEYNEEIEKYKRKLEKQFRLERQEEIDGLEKTYEKRLINIREEVRMEIKSNDKCTIL